jgi:hypothetical protein
LARPPLEDRGEVCSAGRPVPSADYHDSERGRASAAHQARDLMPVDPIGDRLGHGRLSSSHPVSITFEAIAASYPVTSR